MRLFSWNSVKRRILAQLSKLIACTLLFDFNESGHQANVNRYTNDCFFFARSFSASFVAIKSRICADSKQKCDANAINGKYLDLKKEP